MKEHGTFDNNTVHFPPHRNVTNLTVPDLLTVREYWQVPLFNMHNVIATAIGLYRFRHGENTDETVRGKTTVKPRTLDNSFIDRKKSWPCILVFVKDWIPLNRFYDHDKPVGDWTDPHCNPMHIVPQFLYSPQGLVVPTCVISVSIDEQSDQVATLHGYPSNIRGGGAPLVSYVQGERRVGMAACLVHDGHKQYVLSARHVCGDSGEKIYCPLGTEEEQIGISDSMQIQRAAFETLYPQWKGIRAQVNLDAGLIAVDNTAQWTSQLYGLGDIDTVADMNESTIQLGLLGKQVRAVGLGGKQIEGEIHGLFPCYKTMGGNFYYTDLLIGPRQNKRSFSVGPGTSGTLWVYDPEDGAGNDVHKRWTPLALHWGMMDFERHAAGQSFALASFMSTLCAQLDVEVVCGHNTGYGPVWGKTNHITIADIAWDGITRAKAGMKDFLLGNDERKAREAFDTLSFVPDQWSMFFGGGSASLYRPKEGPNHYANIDLQSGGKKLHETTLDPQAWATFYQSIGKKSKLGALPFRIGQCFQEMVHMLKSGTYDRFFCAAGVLIHYCADAANPAHVSRSGKGKEEWGKNNYHKIWDNALLDQRAVTDLFVKKLPGIKDTVADGQAACLEALRLMIRTLKRIDVSTFADPHPEPASAIAEAQAFIKSPNGQKLLNHCALDACVVWYRLCISAWRLGCTGSIQSCENTWSTAHIKPIVSDRSFLPSHLLAEYDYEREHPMPERTIAEKMGRRSLHNIGKNAKKRIYKSTYSLPAAKKHR